MTPWKVLGDLGMGYAMVITASIAAVASVANTMLAFMLRKFMTPPSGGTLGEVVEKTHAQSAVSAAAVKTLIAQEHERVEERKNSPPEGVTSIP